MASMSAINIILKINLVSNLHATHENTNSVKMNLNKPDWTIDHGNTPF